MKETLKLAAIIAVAALIGYLSATGLADVLTPTDVPAVESSDTDDLLVGRYHQRTRVNKFFRRGRA